MHKLGFGTIVQQSINHSRGASAVYQIEDVIELISLGLIAGAFSVSGIETVWSDPVLRELGGWKRIPVDTTMTRILNELDFGQLDKLQQCNHLLRGKFWQSQKQLAKNLNKRELYLDCDSTVVPTCGHQEGAEKGYNPEKHGGKSYHPLLIFQSDTKELLQGWLRGGTAYSSNNCIGFLDELFCCLPESIRYIFRADSGFFDGKILDRLDELEQGYLVKVKNLETTLLKQRHWEQVQKHSEFEQTEFYHQCHGWSKERRFVALRRPRNKDKKPKKKSLKKRLQPELFEFEEYEYFCYVLTEELSPYQAHKSYGKRATCETWIEEFKSQIGGGKLRTKDFSSTDALFQCAILAYNLMRWMAIKSGNDLLIRCEINTLRTYIIRTAGKLVVTGNRYILLFPQSILHKKMFLLWIDSG